jgi:hypothetical protein
MSNGYDVISNGYGVLWCSGPLPFTTAKDSPGWQGSATHEYSVKSDDCGIPSKGYRVTSDGYSVIWCCGPPQSTNPPASRGLQGWERKVGRSVW